MINVRRIEATDKERWLTLWNSYLVFYKEILPESITEITWLRLLDPEFNSYGLVVENENGVQGISHYNFQNSTWAEHGFRFHPSAQITVCDVDDCYCLPIS